MLLLIYTKNSLIDIMLRTFFQPLFSFNVIPELMHLLSTINRTILSLFYSFYCSMIAPINQYIDKSYEIKGNISRV